MGSAGENTLQGRATMAAEVIHTLRGKVITKNERKVEYGEQIEPWSPYNANLHMQGIKVMVKEPMPQKVQKGDAFEDTMLLLEMMKKQQKEELIRAMAMEKKRKISKQGTNQYLKLTF